MCPSTPGAYMQMAGIGAELAADVVAASASDRSVGQQVNVVALVVVIDGGSQARAGRFEDVFGIENGVAGAFRHLFQKES